MRYRKIIPAIFIARPNRFIAEVTIDGQKETVHVKNTGRCRELLIPGTRVYLAESDNPARKTRYDLVTVKKGKRLINMDSQAPNRVFLEWAQAGFFRPDLTLLRPETTYGDSRFDFYWEAAERKGFVEVKGVTLEENDVVRFPDAPTMRGLKHLRELTEARRAGYETAVCFVVQMSDVKHLEPNDATHPAFGAALRQAALEGVKVLALSCRVEPDTVEINGFLPVQL